MATITKLNYRIRPGARINVDAQIAGEQCEELAAEGRLTAENFLELNRPEDAPNHNAFEWDDAIAAEKYRVDQARHIIGSLEIVVDDQPPTKAFYNLVITQPEYEPVTTILEAEDKTKDLCRLVLRELKAYQRKYNNLKQFESVWNAIDQISFDIGA